MHHAQNHASSLCSPLPAISPSEFHSLRHNGDGAHANPENPYVRQQWCTAMGLPVANGSRKAAREFSGTEPERRRKEAAFTRTEPERGSPCPAILSDCSNRPSENRSWTPPGGSTRSWDRRFSRAFRRAARSRPTGPSRTEAHGALRSKEPPPTVCAEAAFSGDFPDDPAPVEHAGRTRSDQAAPAPSAGTGARTATGIAAAPS